MMIKLAILCLVVVTYAHEHSYPPSPDADCADIKPDDDGCCQNFNEGMQNHINQQIQRELSASYTYLSMAAYFDRYTPNMKGFAKFFYAASAEERDHALKLIDYLNLRGGEVNLYALRAPTNNKWDNGLKAMQEALKLERTINEKLLELHHNASTDPHLQDFLETHYLTEQVDSIRQLSGYIAQIKRLHITNPGLGEHIFDKELS